MISTRSGESLRESVAQLVCSPQKSVGGGVQARTRGGGGGGGGGGGSGGSFEPPFFGHLA